MLMRAPGILLMLGITCAGLCAWGEDLFARDRARLSEDNPAVFAEQRGAALWLERAGPKDQTLEYCDLGLGGGVVEGAYAQLPRWFNDAEAVMDIETRLAWCRQRLQGVDQKLAWGADLTALVTWIARGSEGRAIHLEINHPEVKKLVSRGEQLFFYRAGSHDYGCVTCHGESGRRIRLQTLPNLLEVEELKPVMASWPAYRLAAGEVKTLRWRISDCWRQQHFPKVAYPSEVFTALELYLKSRAEGAVMTAPSLKR